MVGLAGRTGHPRAGREEHQEVELARIEVADEGARAEHLGTEDGLEVRPVLAQQGRVGQRAGTMDHPAHGAEGGGALDDPLHVAVDARVSLLDHDVRALLAPPLDRGDGGFIGRVATEQHEVAGAPLDHPARHEEPDAPETATDDVAGIRVEDDRGARCHLGTGQPSDEPGLAAPCDLGLGRIRIVELADELSRRLPGRSVAEVDATALELGMLELHDVADPPGRGRVGIVDRRPIHALRGLGHDPQRWGRRPIEQAVDGREQHRAASLVALAEDGVRVGAVELGTRIVDDHHAGRAASSERVTQRSPRAVHHG